MAEVAEAEVVHNGDLEPRPQTATEKYPEGSRVLTPKKRSLILEEMAPKPEEKNPGLTRGAAAKLAGIHPLTLSRVVEAALENNKHPMYPFARDLVKLEGERQKLLELDMYRISTKSPKIDGVSKMLERNYPDEWGSRQGPSTVINNNMSIVGKLQKVEDSWDRELPTGD